MGIAIRLMYNPKFRLAVVLLFAALLMFECDPHDGPDWGRF